MTVRRKRAPVPKIQEVTNEIGRVYKTNNCGDVVVVEYITTKNITIQFVDTGNTYKTVKDPLEKGLIKDSIEILRAASERQDKIKQERLLRKNLLAEKGLAIEKEKQEKVLQREQETLKTFNGFVIIVIYRRMTNTQIYGLKSLLQKNGGTLKNLDKKKLGVRMCKMAL